MWEGKGQTETLDKGISSRFLFRFVLLSLYTFIVWFIKLHQLRICVWLWMCVCSFLFFFYIDAILRLWFYINLYHFIFFSRSLVLNSFDGHPVGVVDISQRYISHSFTYLPAANSNIIYTCISDPIRFYPLLSCYLHVFNTNKIEKGIFFFLILIIAIYIYIYIYWRQPSSLKWYSHVDQIRTE